MKHLSKRQIQSLLSERQTRYHALYALLDEVTGVDPQRLDQTLVRLANDRSAAESR